MTRELKSFDEAPIARRRGRIDFRLRLRILHPILDMKNIFSILSTCIVTLSAAAGETNSPAPAEDRVGFPKDYAKTFEVLRTVSREEGKKLVTVYGNAQAASVTNRTHLPYPNGSVLVMET